MYARNPSILVTIEIVVMTRMLTNMNKNIRLNQTTVDLQNIRTGEQCAACLDDKFKIRQVNRLHMGRRAGASQLTLQAAP
jgi:hypothetical protein